MNIFKGPWIVAESHSRYFIRDKFGENITYIMKDNIGEGTQGANNKSLAIANLIASAPNLLNSCKMAELLYHMSALLAQPDDKLSCGKWINELRQNIGEAEYGK